MDSSQQLKVLEAAVQLDRGLTQILGHVDLLREVPSSEVIESLAKLLPAAVAAMTDVRERLVGLFDQTAIECVEGALRARAAIVMTQLDELRAAEPQLPSTSLVNAGRFRCVRDLGRALADRIGRINANLARERRELDARTAERASYQALYHVALDNAEHGYTSLGRDPDIVAFLRVGASSASRRFRVACHTIACALDSSLVVDRPRFPPRCDCTQPARQ